MNIKIPISAVGMAMPVFRSERFVLNKMFQQSPSKFAIFHVKENPFLYVPT